MTITLNGTTGVTTPGVTDTGALSVTGISTLGALGSSVITSGTAVASTSGTSVTFSSIPNWVKRITVMFNTVSTNSTNLLQIQVGSGSISTSGYASQFSAGAAASGVLTTGFGIASMAASAASAFTGSVTLCLLGSNTWIEQGHLAYVNGTVVGWTSGGSSPALSGALDQLRVISSATGLPSDTFDLGSINILYE
jgi:hypothetical protein